MDQFKHFAVITVHPGYNPGFVPGWCQTCPKDKTLQEHFNDVYSIGGGWRPSRNVPATICKTTYALQYPGDPDQPVRFLMQVGDELVAMYDHSFVAIISKDGAEIARMD